MKTIGNGGFHPLSKVQRTTGIGSLPHHNVDAALDFSLKMGIPFLPQIPIRNPWEYMIVQALEGLPGLRLAGEGAVHLNVDVWASQSHVLSRQLDEAFSKPANPISKFEVFEPSPTTSSCWQPFLWEIQERNVAVAKVQIAGPMTSQWSLRLDDGSSIDRHSELSTQIFRLVLARSMAMVNRLIACQIQPILYLDEPGLFAFSPGNPRHVLCLQELKLMIQTLRKQGAWVGLHCCSNTDWKSILSLGIDFLSIDSALSLAHALDTGGGKAMETFVESGGKLSLGIIPTGPTEPTGPDGLRTLSVQDISDPLIRLFNSRIFKSKALLSEAIFTPACGLALQSTSDAELILEKLMEAYEYITAP